MEYMISTNFNILNTGNMPTFIISNGKEVIDLTLGTNNRRPGDYFACTGI